MMDNLTIEQRVRQFDLRHGNDAVPIGGWLVFSDGAKRERTTSGALCEPPTDPRERCKVQINYREELLRQAIERFENRKRDLTSRARANLQESARTPAPPCTAEEAAEQLTELQKAVTGYREDLEQARTQLEQTKPAWQREREALSLVNKEKNEQLLATLSTIRL